MKPVSALFSSPHTQWQSHRASAAEQTCVSTLTLQLIASVPSTEPTWSHSDIFLFKKTNKKTRWNCRDDHPEVGNPPRRRLTAETGSSCFTFISTSQKNISRHTYEQDLPTMISFEGQRGRGERENVKKKALKTVRRVLYPTGSMQQLLNGRAVLSGLYTRGRRISFCALREEKKQNTLLPPFENAVSNTAYSSVFRIQICKWSPLKHLL